MQFYRNMGTESKSRIISIWTTILFILSFSNASASAASTPGTVYIRESIGSSAIRYSLFSCSNVSRTLGNGQLYEIETGGNCVNLYSEPSCGGGLIRFRPGRVFSSIKKMDAHRWENDTFVNHETMTVKSVGPCYDRCDPRNWEGAKDDPVQITVYGDEDYAGTRFTLDVKGDECVVLPNRSLNRESIKISGDPSSSCIELHEEPSCGGEYAQLRPGYPHLHDLWWWGMRGNDIAIYAKAVTRCGSYCNKTVPEVNPAVMSSPGENIVTIFDYSGYYGLPTHVNLTGGVCKSLANESIDIVGSIQTYGQCVVLYMEANCTEKRGSYSMQTKGLGGDYYLNKILTSTIPIVRLVKSIRLCDKEFDNNGTESTMSATSANIPAQETTTSKHVEEEAVKLQGSAENEKSENSSNFPTTWTTIFLTFGVLLLMCFSALGGALLSRYYDVVNNADSSARFNVFYKLQS